MNEVKKFMLSDKTAELIRVGYDTVEFSSKIDIADVEIALLTEVKKTATDSDVKFQFSDTLYLFMSPKSFGFYKFTLYDVDRLFQISFNATRCTIKVLASSFYLLTYKEILSKLNTILFQLFQSYDLNVSRVDLAVDIKFNYKFLDSLQKDDFYSCYALDFATYHIQNRCTGFAFTGNNLTLRVYDKLEESFKSEKKALFYKLFGVKDDLEYYIYTGEEKQFVRIEYQLRSEIFKPYSVTPDSLSDLDFFKSIVAYFAENHTKLEGFNEGYLKMFLYFLNVDSNYARVKGVKELEYEQRMYHLEKHLISYLTSYHVLREEMTQSQHFQSEIFDYLKLKLKNSFSYKDSLDRKRRQAGLKLCSVSGKLLKIKIKNK